MYTITVKGVFSAAHALQGRPGPCSRLHGHTWVVEAELASTGLDKDGMVLDFDMAAEALKEAIAPFDHQCLNEVEPFDSIPPTAENVARVIYQRMLGAAESGGWGPRPGRVTVWESGDARASYCPGGDDGSRGG